MDNNLHIHLDTNLPIHQEIVNFSQLLATNFKNKLIIPKADSVYLEIDRIGSFDSSQKYMGVATAIANKLYPEVLLYKTKIVPYMTRLSNYIKEKSESVKKKNPALEYSVISASFSELVDEIINSNKLLGGQPVYLTNEKPIDVPYTDLRGLFKYNNSTYNIYLENILKNKTDYDLENIYKLYLCNISNRPTSNIVMSNVSIASIYDVDNILLIIAALENYLSNNDVEPDVKKTLTTYRENLIRVLKLIKPYYENVIKTELVILYQDDKKVVVEDSNYKKFLETGGTPDAVLGWLVKDGNSSDLTKRTINGLTLNKETYENSWARFVNFSKLAIADQLAEQVKTFLHMDYDIIWDKYVPEDLKDEIDMEESRTIYNQLISNANDMLLKPSMLARVIMSDVFFRHTNFKIFAETMRTYLETDNKINIQDASTFTIIDMVVTYLCNQLELS